MPTTATSSVDSRQFAKSLLAADARTVIRASLPFVLDHMNAGQISQIQRVLDAAVVDPVISAEANAFYTKATHYVGELKITDQAMMRKANQAMQGYIKIDSKDQRTRLNVHDLLTKDALKPETDNPDEADCWKRVKNTLDDDGVWLRVAAKTIRDPEDPSRQIYDTRTFNVWLSVGPDGERVPTSDGRIDRDALLGVTMIGAGYYMQVDVGKMQSALNVDIRRVWNEVQGGMQQHRELSSLRTDYLPVAYISDKLGRAKFPDDSDWRQADWFLQRARATNIGGNVITPRIFLIAASVKARNAAHVLADYIDDTSAGAERGATVAKVIAVTAAVVLVAAGATLALAPAVAAAGGGGAAAGTASSADILAERVFQQYAVRAGVASEVGDVKVLRQLAGGAARILRAGGSAGVGTGWNVGW